MGDLEQRAREMLRIEVGGINAIRDDERIRADAAIRAITKALSREATAAWNQRPNDPAAHERASVVRYLRTWLGSCQCISQANAFADAIERGDHTAARSALHGKRGEG